MANNHVSSLLNISLPKPKRSNFNLGRVNRFSADVGWTIPCYTEEILANSYKRLDVEGLIQTNATVAPLFGTFKVDIDAFFVPLRLYYRHLDLNNIQPDFSDDFDFHFIEMPNVSNSQFVSSQTVASINPGGNGLRYVPIQSGRYLSYTDYSILDEDYQYVRDYETNLIVPPSSLLDYLGILPVGYNARSWKGTKRLNANPLIAYFDIWRNYYANPHDINVPVRVQNTLSDVTFTASEFQPSMIGRQFVDEFIELSSFDNFINDINTSSLLNNQPVSVDVFPKIYNNLKFKSDTVRYYRSLPLFSGQIVVEDKQSSIGGQLLSPIRDTRNGIHFGLLPRTYRDDYFTARFREDFVTYMESSSVVTVENNTFTISQLRRANRIAKYVDKSIFSDTRFGSWIKAHFGVSTNQKLNIPQFLGRISTNIVFNDIYSTAQTGDGDITSNQALGSRSSLGQGYLKNKGSFIEFKASEPGYLMCMFSITPNVSYFQGIKKMYLKTGFYDLYRPEFDAIGYDDLQTFEAFAVGRYANNYQEINYNSFTAIDIDTFNISLGKHPSWLEYMTSIDESHGLLAQRYQYGFWTLNRPYAPNVYNEVFAPRDPNDTTTNGAFVPAPILETSTYIRPEYYNTIFAVDQDTDNFQVQLRFYDKTKQPISKQILPHL